MTAEFGAVLEAPFVRRRILARVQLLVDRYDSLLQMPGTDRLRVPVLFRFPSALRERTAVDRSVLEARRELAAGEIRALKAAAPVPPPDDRPDRLRMQAFAEAQWLARELRVLRRVSRQPGTSPADVYAAAGREDPLPSPERLAPALKSVRRAGLVNLAFDLAAVRFGVPDLRHWLVTSPPAVVGSGPVSAGPAATLDEGQGRRIVIDERPVAVFRVDGQLRAVGAVCPHRGGPLDEGRVQAGAVLCPLHEWAFDLTTGCLKEGGGGRSSMAVPVYRVEVRSGEIFVYPRIDEPGGNPR